MIFVTVGTHEQQFNRLVKKIDLLKGNGIITDDIFIQIGFSTYEPKFCDWKRMISFDEMQKKMSESNIIVTHGGPSSFMMALQEGKIPIVVPRMEKFTEHINNHQVEFSNAVAKKFKNIIVVNDVDELGETINNYHSITKKMTTNNVNNNKKFNYEFELLINQLFE
jgi:UDP-N-acetylglucosamine transferase subunit ALG13